jgi:hypothetical protein
MSGRSEAGGELGQAETSETECGAGAPGRRSREVVGGASRRANDDNP